MLGHVGQFDGRAAQTRAEVAGATAASAAAEELSAAVASGPAAAASDAGDVRERPSKCRRLRSKVPAPIEAIVPAGAGGRECVMLKMARSKAELKASCPTYVFGGFLGGGGCGQVHAATQFGKPVAVKVLEKGISAAYDYANALGEVAVLDRVRGRADCIQLLDVFIDNGGSWNLVFERWGHTWQAALAKPDWVFSAQEARCCLRSLFGALAFLHADVGVVHGDLKPDNVLVRRKEPEAVLELKVCDFGLCTEASGRRGPGLGRGPRLGRRLRARGLRARLHFSNRHTDLNRKSLRDLTLPE